MEGVRILTAVTFAIFVSVALSQEIIEVDSQPIHQIVKRQTRVRVQTSSESDSSGTGQAATSTSTSTESGETSHYQPDRISSGRHYVSPNRQPYYQYRPPTSTGRDGAVHTGSVQRSQTYSYPFGRTSQSSSQNGVVVASTSNNENGAAVNSYGGGSSSGYQSRTVYQGGSSADGDAHAQIRRQQELRRRLYEQQRLRQQASIANNANDGENTDSTGSSSTGQNPSYVAYTQRRVSSTTSTSQQPSASQQSSGTYGHSSAQGTVSATAGGSQQPSQTRHSSSTGYYRGSYEPVSQSFGQGTRTYQTNTGNQNSPNYQSGTRQRGGWGFVYSGQQGQGQSQGQGYGHSSQGRHRYRGQGHSQYWPHETRTNQQVDPRLVLTTQTGRYPSNRYGTGTSTSSIGQLAVEETDSECPNTGIQLSIDGLNCQQAIHQMGTFLCYTHEYTSRDCCQVCKARKRPEKVGCEYGDHASICRTISPSDCYDLRNQASCCETCERYRRRDAAPGCEYGDQTPRCETVRQNPGLCYVPDNQRLCCQTCAGMKNQTDPTCPWGDYNPRLCQLFDNSNDIRINCYSPQRKRICCASCERLRNWIGDDAPADCPYGDKPVVFSTSQYGRLTCSNVFNFFGVDECRTNDVLSRNCCHTCHRRRSHRG